MCALWDPKVDRVSCVKTQLGRVPRGPAMHGCILEPTLSGARADVLSLEPVLWPWKVERLRDELRIDWG